MQAPLIRLQCGVNSYEWGKVGKDSAAARFGAATPKDASQMDGADPTNQFWIQNNFRDDKPYAEV